jgi:hypothetical protein
MFFIGLVLIGMVIPFLLMKINSTWVIWSPAIIFSIAAIFMAVKASVFPGEGMADLAESLYFMMFGTAAVGSIIGGVIVHFFNKIKK